MHEYIYIKALLSIRSIIHFVFAPHTQVSDLLFLSLSLRISMQTCHVHSYLSNLVSQTTETGFPAFLAL